MRRQSSTDEKLATHYLRKGELSRSRNVECLSPFQIRGDAMHKTLTALAVAATFTIAAVAAPQQAEARGGRVAAGIIGGLAAGAIIGGIASQQGYYGGPGYYYLSLIHISEPTRQAEISYAVFCLKKKKSRLAVRKR